MPDTAPIVEPRLSVQIEPVLVRRVDAARLLAVSTRMFDDLVDAGLIGKTRIGGCVAFAVDELRAFVRQCQGDPVYVQTEVEKLRSRRKARRESEVKSSPR